MKLLVITTVLVIIACGECETFKYEKSSMLKAACKRNPYFRFCREGAGDLIRGIIEHTLPLPSTKPLSLPSAKPSRLSSLKPTLPHAENAKPDLAASEPVPFDTERFVDRSNFVDNENTEVQNNVDSNEPSKNAETQSILEASTPVAFDRETFGNVQPDQAKTENSNVQKLPETNPPLAAPAFPRRGGGGGGMGSIGINSGFGIGGGSGLGLGNGGLFGISSGVGVGGIPGLGSIGMQSGFGIGK